MRTGKVSSDVLLFYLVLFVVALNLLLPGETWFQTRALSQLLIFAALGALQLVRAREGAVVLIFLFLLCFMPSMLFSVCPGRSLETLSLWLAYLGLFILIRRLRPDPQQVEGAITLVCLVAVVLLLYALYQYFTGFGGLAGEVAAAPGLTEGQRADMLGRLASRRVFSTFPLPTTFAQMIVIVLPLLVHRLRSAGRRGRRLAAAGWCAALLLAAGVLPLTGSYGILPVLAVLGILAILAAADRWSPGRRAAVGGAVVLCVAIAFLVVLQVRGFTPWAAEQAHNPVSQRVFNWRTAVSIWLEHPLAGAGPGNFAVAYARHRLPGANETVVAHNTFLHAAAEGGLLPGAALLLLALLLGWRAVRRLFADQDGAVRALCYATLALLLYACFEITVEFPGIGYPGIFLLSLASLRLFPPRVPAPDPPVGERAAPAPVSLGPAGAAVMALILLAGFFWTCTWYRGQQHQARAMARAAEGPAAQGEALRAAEDASRWNPLDPEPQAVTGALLLAAGSEQRDQELIRRAGAAFRSASALDPQRAFFHERLSVVHQGLGEELAALVEADKAFRCYPLQPRYRDRRAEMLRRMGGS